MLTVFGMSNYRSQKKTQGTCQARAVKKEEIYALQRHTYTLTGQDFEGLGLHV